ncbi:MAG: alpha/beta hydrolase [Dactylosporangium sp.]|nr:alpha/beta hydrolase [Dactylosporangium sp.]NNJ59867.1 alpha/beta hydrolase [Dactylosporangium sp.]
MSPWVTRRGAGIVGAALGVAAATVATGVAAERYLLRRSRQVEDPYADEPFGELAATSEHTVQTTSDLDLHVEVVEATGAGTTDDLTIVFVHGFCLDMGTFHFQRTHFAGTYRMVFYDQPGHGRSGHLTDGDYSLDDLAGALTTVIEQVAPTGRLVLVGHSMGGMTIMALAERQPKLIAKRVAGIALISTSAGQIHTVNFGMPQVVAQARRPLLPVVRAAGPAAAGVIDRARSVTSEVAWLLTRKYGFGTAQPSPALVSYVERMNSATSLDVIARYLGTIHHHDRLRALRYLRDVPAVVLCGDRDLITPLEHSTVIAAALPAARLEIIPDGGHVAILEHADVVNAILADLCTTLRG